MCEDQKFLFLLIEILKCEHSIKDGFEVFSSLLWLLHSGYRTQSLTSTVSPKHLEILNLMYNACICVAF